MSIFKGSAVALVTPFTNNGVNYPKLKELIEWHINEGTDAIVICGTTGEATTMSEDEKRETIKFTVNVVNKRIPVIAGTGSNNTKHSIEMSQYAETVGVDALLLITPYYNKTSDLGLLKHFKEINNNVNIPIVLYNAPGRTCMNITPVLLLELSRLSNVVAIKEASSNISQAIKMKSICGDTIDIYSGDDDLIVPIMSIGGLGVISVVANIMPKEIHMLCKNFLDGKVQEALDIQLKTLNLINTLFIETNPIPVKDALNLMGKDVGPLRLPLCEMEGLNKDKLINILKSYNLI
ncbi:MAG: 4-hydroxy-tetrahydrodipicolinate synthase [Clostridium sp.]